PKRSGMQSNVTERVGPADELTNDVHAAGHTVQVDKVHQTREAIQVLGDQSKDEAVGDVELQVRNREEIVKKFKGDRVRASRLDLPVRKNRRFREGCHIGVHRHLKAWPRKVAGIPSRPCGDGYVRRYRQWPS